MHKPSFTLNTVKLSLHFYIPTTMCPLKMKQHLNIRGKNDKANKPKETKGAIISEKGRNTSSQKLTSNQSNLTSKKKKVKSSRKTKA